jgi:hypothetical protein
VKVRNEDGVSVTTKVAGWCVHGWLNCPICMDDSDTYRLEHGKNVTFFDCHQ